MNGFDVDYTPILREGLKRPIDWHDYNRKHALCLMLLPAFGPFTEWELISEHTGKAIARGGLPINQERLREHCSQYHKDVDAENGWSN